MNRRSKVIALAYGFGIGLLVWCWMGSADAHMTSMGTLLAKIVPEKRQIRVVVSVSRDDIGTFLKLDKNADKRINESELSGHRPAIARYINERVVVSNNSRFCSVTHQKYLRRREVMSKRRLFLRLVFHCGQPLKKIVFENKILFEDVGGYKHMGRIQSGRQVFTTIFNRIFPSYSLEIRVLPSSPAKAGSKVAPVKLKTVVVGRGLWQVFVRYMYQGVLHILIGIDHILFVICLLVAAQNVRQLLLVISAFTVGHSLTLILCVLGWVSVPQAMTEVLIAVTIAYVASENLAEGKSIKLFRGLMWGLAGLSAMALIWLLAVPLLKNNPLWRPIAVGASMLLAMGFFIYYTLDIDKIEPASHRFWLTGLFGLIHGVGFSFVLQELQLPKQAMVPALLSFNLGVELGQIGIVLLIYPMLRRANNHEKYPKFLTTVNTLILLAALYWVIVRTFGLE